MIGFSFATPIKGAAVGLYWIFSAAVSFSMPEPEAERQCGDISGCFGFYIRRPGMSRLL